MDSIPAVGAEIQPPNPLGAFSNVLGIKQQMVGLQTAQAQAQQAQQQNQELTALHQFVSKAVHDPKYLNPDGTLNTQKFQQDAMSVAGVYGQPYIGQATSNATESVNNRKALLDLSNDQRKTIGNYFSQVAADPNASKASFLDAVEQARGASSDPSYQRSLDSMLLTMPNIGAMRPDQANKALRAFSRNIAVATESPSAGVSAPSVVVTQGPKGLQSTQVSPLSPLGVGTQGQPIAQGIAPQVVTQPATGAVNVLGPGGQARPVTNAPSNAQRNTPQQVNWWNPPAGAVNLLNQNVAALSNRTQAGIAAANTTPQAIDALDRMRAILDQGAWTGTAFSGFKDLKNLAASMGIDTTGAQNSSELVKNMARYEAARAAAVGDTDASRALVEAGSPNFKMDAKAVKAVVLQSLANERIIQSYGKLMEGTQNPQEAMQKEQQFRSIPHLLQMFELGELKSKPEVDAFLKRYNISGADLAKSYQQYQQVMGQ